MDNRFSRLEILIGYENFDRLVHSHVAVFGVGGVGGYVVESLVRSGIGEITVIDYDTVSLTNLNRQIIAIEETIGKKKVDVIEKRIMSINPECEVHTYDMLYLKETADSIDLTRFDYVVDAVDNISAKLELIERCQKLNIPIISCMGTGNKLDPSMLEITDIYKTSVCPLAKVMRRELKKRNIKKQKVLYSKEYPIKPLKSNEETNKREVVGSTSFVPSSAGLLIGSFVVRELIK
ncbi:MAG: tRNA threonylcarbamoyladenosine dehydratase [Bacilli bacterium]|nr:tRNA threonylcarbamoyladenosine dehydratase [Bacilli bacterium]